MVENIRLVLIHIGSVPFTVELFTLLHQFGTMKHFAAPSLYKLIMQRFSDVEDSNSDIYAVFLDNFRETITQFPAIPWKGVLDTVLGRKKSLSSQ